MKRLIQPLSAYEKKYSDCLAWREPQLVAILYGMTDSKQMAVDAAESAIFVAYELVRDRRVESLGNSCDRWKWLIGVGRHKALDIKYRSRWARCTPIKETDCVVMPRLAKEDDAPDEFDCIHAAIEHLPPYLRALAVYLYFDDSGHSQSEAAKHFGVTEGAIAGKVRRLKELLRDELSVTLKNLRNPPAM